MKLTTEKYIEKAKASHNDTFDYSETVYFGSRDKLKVICKIHGLFEQFANNHLRGAGCPQCALVNRTKKLCTFIEEANLIYNGKFSYKNFVYNGAHKKGIIICKIHGIFKQIPAWHLQGFGCPKCNRNRRSKNDLKTTDHFIAKSKLRHGNTYEYDCSEYKGTDIKVKIKCKIHGIFEQYPTNHYFGYGCPICKSSHGEIAIQKFLEQKAIFYKNGYILPTCKYKKALPFDFAIFNGNKLPKSGVKPLPSGMGI
jgi:hypothetical protein